ncbi:hypothetical protein ABTX62_34190 [Streptomyces sp. NPDC096046]|uniref:hypothetical protein n=1 Tax=Streptomyces sp. NPDC096046 TaxID=3155542 RepID=UPI003325BAE8
MTTADIQHEEIGGKTVTVTVDGEPVEVPKRTTPNAVLGLVGIDVAAHYLVRSPAGVSTRSPAVGRMRSRWCTSGRRSCRSSPARWWRHCQ